MLFPPSAAFSLFALPPPLPHHPANATIGAVWRSAPRTVYPGLILPLLTGRFSDRVPSPQSANTAGSAATGGRDGAGGGEQRHFIKHQRRGEEGRGAPSRTAAPSPPQTHGAPLSPLPPNEALTAGQRPCARARRWQRGRARAFPRLFLSSPPPRRAHLPPRLPAPATPAPPAAHARPSAGQERERAGCGVGGGCRPFPPRMRRARVAVATGRGARQGGGGRR